MVFLKIFGRMVMRFTQIWWRIDDDETVLMWDSHENQQDDNQIQLTILGQKQNRFLFRMKRTVNPVPVCLKELVLKICYEEGNQVWDFNVLKVMRYPSRSHVARRFNESFKITVMKISRAIGRYWWLCPKTSVSEVFQVLQLVLVVPDENLWLLVSLVYGLYSVKQMKLLKNMIDLSYEISEKLGEASVKGEIVDVMMCLILQQSLTEDARKRDECEEKNVLMQSQSAQMKNFIEILMFEWIVLHIVTFEMFNWVLTVRLLQLVWRVMQRLSADMRRKLVVVSTCYVEYLIGKYGILLVGVLSG